MPAIGFNERSFPTKSSVEQNIKISATPTIGTKVTKLGCGVFSSNKRILLIIKNKPKIGKVCVSIWFFVRPYFNSISAKTEPISNSQKREYGKKKFSSEFLVSIIFANWMLITSIPMRKAGNSGRATFQIRKVSIGIIM